jgi:hypothetical protein
MQIKDKKGNICGTREATNSYKILVENLKGRNNLEALVAYGRMILNVSYINSYVVKI